MKSRNEHPKIVNATEKDDLDDMIDDARFFDGKQMDEHDKELVRSILKRIYNEK